MFDNLMICHESAENVVTQGKQSGFSFMTRLPYYRGLGLSMVEDISVIIDGVQIERKDVSVTLRGKTWTLDALEQVYDERWNFAEQGKISICMPGGLAPGMHKLKVSKKLRISYLPFNAVTVAEAEINI